MKLIGAGVLTPDSTVTYDRIGLSATEQRILASDKRRAQAQARLSALSAAAQASQVEPDPAQPQEPAPSAPEVE